MKAKIIFVIQFIFLLILSLLGSGVWSPFSKPVPPPLAFLDPWKGIWHHNAGVDKTVSLKLEGLKNEASIIYDDRWVPHVYAENKEDLLFLQGYVEAQNRLFQIEFLSLAAAGELSSVMGNVTFAYDLDKRRRGMKYAAEKAVEAWKKMPDYPLFERYIDGINAYISSLIPEEYPLEFKLLNYKPTEWTALKSALIFKEMSLTLCGKNSDLPMTNVKMLLDSTTFNNWYNEHENFETPVVPEHVSFPFESVIKDRFAPESIVQKLLKNSYIETRQPGIGSNQWTVGQGKTASGSNIFCNDPHLSLGLPSIWFEQHLVCNEFNAYGVSFPGFPGIMIGFNEDIAWGETNVGQDVEDMFLIEWADSLKQEYILDNKKVKVEKRLEHIAIRGSDKVFVDTVLYTHFGPVIKTSKDGKSDLTMRWLAHDQPDHEEFMTFVKGMMAKNYDEYLAATDVFQTPAQNFGFASKDGTIAIRVNGKLPAKSDQDGRFVEYGNRSKNNWTAFIPRSQNPQVINPIEGFVASANQRSTGRSYPYYYNGNFENYRNKTIHKMLSSSEKLSPENMKKMQTNAYSAKADGFIGIIPLACRNVQSKHKLNWFDKLKSWNKHYLKDRVEPVFYEIYMEFLRDLTYDEFDIYKDSVQVVKPKDWVLLDRIQNAPNDALFNIRKTSTIENAENIQITAFYQAVKRMDSLMTEKPSINWGNYKPLHIHHLAKIPALSEHNIEADGCPDAVNAKGISFGPSWRMIVHQTTPIEAYGVYPGGQSGNPFSPYYKNMIQPWVEGQYFTLRNDTNPETLKDITHSSISCKTK